MWPLVLRKAYGRRAGRIAAALVVATSAILLALLDLGLVRATIPAMVVLGPLTVAQYLVWRRRGRERTDPGVPAGRADCARVGAGANQRALVIFSQAVEKLAFGTGMVEAKGLGRGLAARPGGGSADGEGPGVGGSARRRRPPRRPPGPRAMAGGPSPAAGAGA